VNESSAEIAVTTTADWPSIAPVVSIEPPSRRHLTIELGPLWEYRQLLYFLTWRDLKVRYKQTALGASWAILQPLLTTIVFATFFGRVAHLRSEGVPYFLFVFTGMLAWSYFSNAITAGSNSVVMSASMISKVYFPRIALPISSVLGAIVDFLCGFVFLVPLLAWYRAVPTIRILALPLFFLLATVVALGTAVMLAALSVRYRDVKYVIPFLTQLWLFATPVAYSAASLGQPWVLLYRLNPLVGVVDGFRWSLLGTGRSPDWSTLISACAGAALLVCGAAYFQRVDESMADVI
jgi:homopolymeric O-antigen transport system permease protein